MTFHITAPQLKVAYRFYCSEKGSLLSRRHHKDELVFLPISVSSL